ncbi:MAG TPA: MarR family transcriptional regulator [Allosphingosinicella sp.]|jgi:DNA-binding MarR family transcriptional regulator
MPDSDFITELGRPFLAHRLRRLAEAFVDGYGRWLPTLGIDAPPRSLSTLLLLEREGPLGVTEIAARLRLSHPLLIRLTRALEARGLTRAERDSGDGRRRLIALTEAGRAQAQALGGAIRVIDRAYEDLLRETGIDMMEGCARVEAACRALSFEERLERAAAGIHQQGESECATSA